MAARNDGLEKPLAPIAFPPLNAKERAARAALQKAEAEKRLKEAEARLLDAIKELNRSHGKDPEASSHSGRHLLCKHGDSCVANAISSLCQSFLLAYGVRVGIGVLLRAFKLAKRRPFYSFLDLKLLLSEKNLIVREEACRAGLLFGGFTGSFHAIRCFLRRVRGTETPLNEFVAGSVAGLSILALDDRSRRRTFALYLLARVAQCAYNSAKSKGKFHFWGSHWRHGDTLLFALSSAQVMYAFVMRPETLPESYFEFIVNTGPVKKPALKAVRECCRGGPVDVTSLAAYIQRSTGSFPTGLHSNMQIIPCSAVHPDTASCLKHDLKAMQRTFKKTFPLYMSLTFVPFVVLNIQKFMQAPLRTCWNALKGAVRSTFFLSTFVGIYQAVICLQRKISVRDHKFVYWFAGASAALSALFEKKSRRSELALYVLPRAADSLWYILVNRHLLPDIKYAEVALFCLCMGGVAYYHEYEPETMAPFLRGLIARFLNRTGTPDQQTMLSSSYQYFQPSLPGSEVQAVSSLGGSSDLSKDLESASLVAQNSFQKSASMRSFKDRGQVRDKAKNLEDPSQAEERLKTEAFQGESIGDSDSYLHLIEEYKDYFLGLIVKRVL